MWSYLRDRTQKLSISGTLSSEVTINRGCPQGSRLSPLLFLVLMSDLNLHTEKSKITNFADDTQIHICEESEESLRTVTKEEAGSVIAFFEGIKLSNNPDKAALLYNSRGKGKYIELEVGGKILKSSNDEKLLGKVMCATKK